MQTKWLSLCRECFPRGLQRCCSQTCPSDRYPSLLARQFDLKKAGFQCRWALTAFQLALHKFPPAAVCHVQWHSEAAPKYIWGPGSVAWSRWGKQVHSGEPGWHLDREEELFGHCAMDFLLAVWWERRVRGHRRVFLPGESSYSSTLKGNLGPGTIFPHSPSRYKVGGCLIFRPYPVHSPVCPVLPTVVGTGCARSPHW